MALARELSFRLPLQRGDDVRAVQQALIRAGTLAGAADGIFGPATHRAVVDFQRRMQARHPGFAADGIVGRQSWSALFPDAAPRRGGEDPRRGNAAQIAPAFRPASGGTCTYSPAPFPAPLWRAPSCAVLATRLPAPSPHS